MKINGQEVNVALIDFDLNTSVELEEVASLITSEELEEVSNPNDEDLPEEQPSTELREDTDISTYEVADHNKSTNLVEVAYFNTFVEIEEVASTLNEDLSEAVDDHITSTELEENADLDKSNELGEVMDLNTSVELEEVASTFDEDLSEEQPCEVQHLKAIHFDEEMEDVEVPSSEPEPETNSQDANLPFSLVPDYELTPSPSKSTAEDQRLNSSSSLMLRLSPSPSSSPKGQEQISPPLTVLRQAPSS